jgi:hypothetical protein
MTMRVCMQDKKEQGYMTGYRTAAGLDWTGRGWTGIAAVRHPPALSAGTKLDGLQCKIGLDWT